MLDTLQFFQRLENGCSNTLSYCTLYYVLHMCQSQYVERAMAKSRGRTLLYCTLHYVLHMCQTQYVERAMAKSRGRTLSYCTLHYVLHMCQSQYFGRGLQSLEDVHERELIEVVQATHYPVCVDIGRHIGLCPNKQWKNHFHLAVNRDSPCTLVRQQ